MNTFLTFWIITVLISFIIVVFLGTMNIIDKHIGIIIWGLVVLPPLGLVIILAFTILYFLIFYGEKEEEYDIVISNKQ